MKDSLEAAKAFCFGYAEKYDKKPRLQVSVSGGRTSALMARLVKEELSAYFDLLFLFANTSREHPDTLRFLNDVDQQFGLGLVWLEAVVREGRKSCGHRVVSYSTAKRDGEVFEDVVRKYGLPNQTFGLCTRELKLNAMKSYLREIGWVAGSYYTALGIRADETRRVSDSALEQMIVYPLAHWWPMDKQDVLAFWEDFSWDLAIKEYEGNCVDCHKKSDKKLALLASQNIGFFDFPKKLDTLYSNVGPNNVPGPRRRYRGRMTTEEKLASFKGLPISKLPTMTEDGGCSESCEIYEMIAGGAT